MPLRKIGIVTAAVVAIAAAALTLPSVAYAKGGHHHHHGGHGGWGWGAFGLGLGTGLVVGGAPYWGGGYSAYGYAPDCYLRRQWVINRYGHRVLRTRQVCY